MASPMEVDEGGAAATAAEQVVVHPLAIVNMSDHFTRIHSGGSPLPVHAPVQGLLFGSPDATSSIVTIQDAGDIPFDITAAAPAPATAAGDDDAQPGPVELHQAVYPHHQVIGWYKVVVANASGNVDPTADDLHTTRALQHQYQTNTNNNATPFLFAHLQVKDPSATKPANPVAAATANIMQDTNEEEEDDDLPMTWYRASNDHNVLVALDDEAWTFSTDAAEKVAIEGVMRGVPPPSSESESSNGTTTEATIVMGEWESSFQQMAQRIQILLQYMKSVQAGEYPFNPSLARQVQRIVLHLGPLATQAPTEAPASSLVPTLAVLGRTVQAVQSYTLKCKAVQEAAAAPSMSAAAAASSMMGGGGMPFDHRRMAAAQSAAAMGML